jgi:hypothetical protein
MENYTEHNEFGPMSDDQYSELEKRVKASEKTGIETQWVIRAIQAKDAKTAVEVSQAVKELKMEDLLLGVK